MIRLASTPMPHVSSVAHSLLDLFRIQSDLQPMHRPIPAPEPDPEPNPAPDAVQQKNHPNITSEDWDQLFRAVQARLEHCVGDALDKAPELALHDRHTVTKAAVLECVEALKQLHMALTLERKEWQEQRKRAFEHQQHQPSQLQRH